MLVHVSSTLIFANSQSFDGRHVCVQQKNKTKTKTQKKQQSQQTFQKKQSKYDFTLK
jgi:hypothetical protein